MQLRLSTLELSFTLDSKNSDECALIIYTFYILYYYSLLFIFVFVPLFSLVCLILYILKK